MAKVRTQNTARVRQGDIIRDVEFIEFAEERKGIIEVSKIVFPLVVVLTQDCDLEQDYRFRWSRVPAKTQDKWLFSVIVAPIYNAEHVYAGTHLTELRMKMADVPRTKSPGDFLRQNERPRYHYIEFPPGVSIVPSVVDFKHYFTANIKYLKKTKKTNFICTLSDLARADIAHRFANYLSRIGLPEVISPVNPTSAK